MDGIQREAAAAVGAVEPRDGNAGRVRRAEAADRIVDRHKRRPARRRAIDGETIRDRSGRAELRVHREPAAGLRVECAVDGHRISDAMRPVAPQIHHAGVVEDERPARRRKRRLPAPAAVLATCMAPLLSMRLAPPKKSLVPVRAPDAAGAIGEDVRDCPSAPRVR